jgi:hypothetical protein
MPKLRPCFELWRKAYQYFAIALLYVPDPSRRGAEIWELELGVGVGSWSWELDWELELGVGLGVGVDVEIFRD